MVSVISDPDQPLADAEPVSRDKQSGNAIYSPDGIRIAFASGPDDPYKPGNQKTAEENKNIDELTWYIWRAMPDGQEPVRLAEARGVSPAWLRPDLPTPVPTAKEDKAPIAAKPDPAAATSSSQAALTKPARPDKPIAAEATPAPAAAVSRVADVPTQSAPPPPPPRRPTPVPQAAPVQASQPVAEAAALKLRVSVSFDASSDEITLSSLGSVQKAAGRASQYPPELIRVYGPLDTSPLRGAYPSQEARSKARAERVAAIIAQDKGVPAAQIKTVPYIPAGAGSKSLANGIQIYVNLK